MLRPRLALAALVAASVLGPACAQGTDESEVALRIYEGIAICDREGCWDDAGNEVRGEAVSAGAILSRAASGFERGVYLYVGAPRVDGRYFELEVDIPTARTGTTGVDAQYREYEDGRAVYESQLGGGQVRLILEDRSVNPPAGRFDLQFEDGRGELRRVVGSFHNPDVPPVSDRPIVDQVEADDRETVYVDYESPPDDWDLYVDYGCGVENDPDSEPAPETSPSSGGGGCEGDSGGDGSSDGGGCEGDSYDGGDTSGGGCDGDSGGGGGGCEGDSGGGSGCEGDTGGGGGCEGGDSCSVAQRRNGTRRLVGGVFPYVLIALVRMLRRRP